MEKKTIIILRTVFRGPFDYIYNSIILRTFEGTI